MAAHLRELDPSSPRGLYGAELRRLRLAAGSSLDALAKNLHRSKAFLSDIERGETPVPPGLSEQLDAFFETDGMFLRMYPAARKDVHPNRYKRFMDLDAKAEQIEEYAAHVVPGLLQTPDYARALIKSNSPDASPDEVETRVAARLERQARFVGLGRPRYWVVLDEAVLHRPVGGRQAMVIQLKALLQAVENRVVTLQVVPYELGEHPALGGSLTLLTLPNRSLVAYLEGFKSGELVEDPVGASEYEQTYDRLRAVALPPEASAEMIRAALKEFSSNDSHDPHPGHTSVAQEQLQQRRRRQLRGSRRPHFRHRPRPRQQGH
ncbi:helix-turn-helix domain-containing protein [Yinghuangia sp. YIM S10712]|uniref:helix-turn-helix domain-containing protein n=1 Tax=Yinghuangia sp. YIM S10712 TaxID=3436930 RepID=UPI003F53B759